MSDLFGASEQAARNYPLLTLLMDGYFHQDFDVYGDSVSDVMTAWKADSTAADQTALRTEIERYVLATRLSLEQSFQTDFRPQVIPSAFSGSTENFLCEIMAALK